MDAAIGVALISAISSILCVVISMMIRKEVKAPNGTKTGELVQKIFERLDAHYMDLYAHEPMRLRWEDRRDLEDRRGDARRAAERLKEREHPDDQ